MPDPRDMVHLVLANAGDKGTPKTAREQLDAGAVYPVDLIVSGTLAGETIEPLAICGQLQVGHDGTFQKTVSPNAGAVLALVLQAVPKSRREETCGRILATWLNTGELPTDRVIPAADPACAQLAAELLQKLSYVTPCPKRGSVSFEFKQNE